MTTTTPTVSSTRKAPTRAELDRFVPGLLDWLEADGRDVDAELAGLVRPLHLTPPPSTAERAAGIYFDLDDVARFVRFARKLRHVKGRKFAGRRLDLDLWQLVYIAAPVLGWKRPDGLRYFSELFEEVPRKNGKSTLCAALALYLLTADREPGAEVISAAKDRGQARAVFDVAARMAERSPELARRLNITRLTGVITFEATASTYTVVSSDRGGDRKHGLNLHAAVVDELHVITDRELIGTIETSTGSREQPLIIYITTAGIESESPVWAEKRKTVIDAAAGVTPAPGVWGVIFGAPPTAATDGTWELEATWQAANPGYGRSVRREYLKKEAGKARHSAAALNRFLRLHLGIPQDALSSWVEIGAYDRSASLVDEADLAGARCYGGLDLSSSLDLSALVLVFPDDANEVVDVVARFWTPADRLEQRSTKDRADYGAWRDAGFLTATPGETINLDFVELEILELLHRHDLRALGFDPWGSLQLRSHLEEAGAPIFDVRQGFASLSPPMKLAEALIYERRLRHGGNPVLRFCISNTTVALDPAGNIKPDRKRSRSRIDGTLGLLMALSEWQRDIAGGRSTYEDRDVDVVAG